MTSSAGDLLSYFWTPIVVVTAAADGRGNGQVAVSVHGASIVPQRPRLTVALWKDNLTHDLVRRAGAFAVHLLRHDQDALVYHFGLQSGREVDKLAAVPHETGVTGTPLLLDCLGVFECRVLTLMDGGDMTVFLGEVVHSAVRGQGDVLWWRDLRARMPAEKLALWEAKLAESIARSLQAMDRIPRA